MTGTNLPATEKEFTEQLKVYFPKVWDMKYVMSKKNLHGGLQKVLAAGLSLSLPVGETLLSPMPIRARPDVPVMSQ